MNAAERQTCREALEYRKEQTEKFVATMAHYGVASREHVERVAAIDAALAALDAPQPQPVAQGLDMPDGVGLWAWEGYFDFGDDDVNPNDTQRLVCEVVSVGMRQYAHTLGRGAYQVKSMVGKWYRLTMPWEAQPLPQPPMPDDVREAIRNALTQRKHDLSIELEVDDPARYAELTAPYDKAFAWLDAHSPRP